MHATQWLLMWSTKVKEAFGKRLLFLGVQGSVRRGEATETSDIDVVVILDGMTGQDMNRYRQLVQSMPQREKACGFVCDVDTLRAWPGYDLFQLCYDTQALHGNLQALLPPLSRRDVMDAMRVEAANLYHACCQAYLYHADVPEALLGLYKSAFFLLRIKVYAQSGRFVLTKRELPDHLIGEERQIALQALDPRSLQRQRCVLLAHVEPLLRLCQRVLRDCEAHPAQAGKRRSEPERLDVFDAGEDDVASQVRDAGQPGDHLV